MRAVLIDALEKQYEAEISAADAVIKLILEKSVAISDQVGIQKELDCQLHKVASAEEKLQVLKDYEISQEEKNKKEEEIMEELTFIDKVRRIIKMRHDDVVAAMVSGGVDNMEKYQYMLGQLRTYQYMSQEISSLFEKKEQKDSDGTVISIKPQGSPKV